MIWKEDIYTSPFPRCLWRAAPRGGRRGEEVFNGCFQERLNCKYGKINAAPIWNKLCIQIYVFLVWAPFDNSVFRIRVAPCRLISEKLKFATLSLFFSDKNQIVFSGQMFEDLIPILKIQINKNNKDTFFSLIQTIIVPSFIKIKLKVPEIS